MNGWTWTELKGKHLAGRAYLQAQLLKRGFSRRRSLRVLNFIFREMSAALARGEEVEFPFGKLKIVRYKHGKTQGKFVNGITTIYKNPFTVVHVMDARGEKRLQPKPKRRKVILPPKPVHAAASTQRVAAHSVADIWRLNGE